MYESFFISARSADNKIEQLFNTDDDRARSGILRVRDDRAGVREASEVKCKYLGIQSIAPKIFQKDRWRGIT